MNVEQNARQGKQIPPLDRDLRDAIRTSFACAQRVYQLNQHNPQARDAALALLEALAVVARRTQAVRLGVGAGERP